MVYRQFESLLQKRFKRVMQDRLNQYIIMTLGIFMIIIGYGYIPDGLPKVHQLHVSEFGALEIILAIVTVTIGISLIFYTSATDNGHFKWSHRFCCDFILYSNEST